MKTYELTYILSSGITSEDADTIKKDVETLVQSKEGLVLKSQKTVPLVLAYPIKKNSSGYFVTLEFQITEGAIKEIKDTLVKDSKVLRHALLVKKPVKPMKKRRTKPVMAEAKPVRTALQNVMDGKKVKEAKVDLEDIEKKLDEILN